MIRVNAPSAPARIPSPASERFGTIVGMEVQLLGDVAVVSEQDRCPIVAPLPRICLGALALSPGSLSLDSLADALWGDRLPANWKPALRNVVAKLRRHLDGIGAGGSAVVATTPTGYRLGAACVVDVALALGKRTPPTRR